ncbi:MAG: hypothetical protein D6698_07435 [Gammaproteobacteria bacterium]|nr:MAG: hypothetical protein D6698_07435 [Gammaproteobacteria bacterium]
MFHVSERNPRVIDRQFAEAFPALDLKATANSGSFHGDGDLRPRSVRYDRLTFAMESKCRFSSSRKHCRPTSAEWAKAISQLSKFDRTAIKLFLVYNAPMKTWSVNLSLADWEILKQTYDLSTIHPHFYKLRHQNKTYEMVEIQSSDWIELYLILEQNFN